MLIFGNLDRKKNIIINFVILKSSHDCKISRNRYKLHEINERYGQNRT